MVWSVTSSYIICNIVNHADCLSPGEMTQTFDDFVRDESCGSKEVILLLTPELRMNLLPPFDKCYFEFPVIIARGVISCNLHLICFP